MTRYGMAIDLNACFGCQTCAAACKIANNVPKGMAYNVVFTKNDDGFDTLGTAVARGAVANDNASGEFPNCKLGYLPFQCQHCENPACLSVCPTGATQKREDGIVWIDEEMCIGCEACINVCPYQGARTSITEEVAYYVDKQLGEIDAPLHMVGTVEKCTFCYNLIDRGEEPACMQLCPGRARFWGDLDNPESAVSKAMAGREVVRLVESAGTEPNVFYLK